MKTCRNCDRDVDRHSARGYCNACYQRWRYAGFPDTGPPARYHAAAGRREDYGWLRTEQRLGRNQAAHRVGIDRRTAYRYERRLAGAA